MCCKSEMGFVSNFWTLLKKYSRKNLLYVASKIWSSRCMALFVKIGTEVWDVVQKTGIKTILKKKKYKKAKWLIEEVLQIAVKRREVKSKGEKEGYTHLNVELQRIARRDKKAFLSDQCKEIEENNRLGKTRDLFKKIRYQENISCKDGLNKGQKWYGSNRSRRY